MSIITDAYRKQSVLEAAHAYCDINYSVIPLRGKQPSISDWIPYQTRRASHVEIDRWHKAGLLQNVGIVLGAVSCGLICIDLDGDESIETFKQAFPRWFYDTMNIESGSGHGRHLYMMVDLPSKNLPQNTITKGYELRCQSLYMVAPPSKHPESGRIYRAVHPEPLDVVDNLEDVRYWIKSQSVTKGVSQSSAKSDTTKRIRTNAQEKYINTTINNLVGNIARASVGNRNNTLFNSACMLGQLVGGGELSRQEAEEELMLASRMAGLTVDEALKTIDSGLKRGMNEPRKIPVGA